MGHAFIALAQWAYANVLGNLVASVLWAAPAFILHHRRLTKHHEMQIQSLHDRLDLHFGANKGPHAEDLPTMQDGEATH